MKLVTKAILTLAIVATGTAFADDLGYVVMQDSHGNLRPMYFRTNDKTPSVALYTRGQSVGATRVEADRSEWSAIAETNQHAQTITRYSHLQ